MINDIKEIIKFFLLSVIMTGGLGLLKTVISIQETLNRGSSFQIEQSWEKVLSQEHLYSS